MMKYTLTAIILCAIALSLAYPKLFQKSNLKNGEGKTDPQHPQSSSIRPGLNYLEDTQTSSIQPGDKIRNFSFRDIGGNSYDLTECTANGSAVFVFMSTTCPLAKKYTQRLNRLARSYEKKITFVAVFPNSDESNRSIGKFARRVSYPFPSVKDSTGIITSALGATMTPQAILIDTNGIVRYQGAIDDHPNSHSVKNYFLKDAMDAVLDGVDVTVKSAKAMGCTIHRDEASQIEPVTYSGHIAEILQDNCMSCHREGQVAPFSLTNYEEAKRWKTEIREYTKARVMPPWKAADNVADYKNDISLSAEEIELIDEWVRQGAPLGNRNEVRSAPEFKNDWAYGKPDLVVEMPEEYVIGPEGEDDYRHFVIPYEAVKGKFINAVDVRPGNHNVVHHVLAYFDTSGKARELDAADQGPGYSRFGDVGFEPASVLGGWAPGSRPIKTPIGSGHYLPVKGDIVLQIHYYRTGVEERDKTKIGFYFSKHPRTVPTRGAILINKKFVIPANQNNVKIQSEFQLEEDNYVYSLTPHMHLLGKTVKVTAYPPGKEPIQLVQIDDWDFNWQATYHFSKLRLMPKGTIFRMVATYDNSEANPNNPYSPPRDIGWGEKTTDEMCISFVGLLRKTEYQSFYESNQSGAVTDVHE